MTEHERSEQLQRWDRLAGTIVIAGLLGLVLCGLQLFGSQNPDTESVVRLVSWVVFAVALGVVVLAVAQEWQGPRMLILYLSLPASLLMVIFLWDEVGGIMTVAMLSWVGFGLYLRKKARIHFQPQASA